MADRVDFHYRKQHLAETEGKYDFRYDVLTSIRPSNIESELNRIGVRKAVGVYITTGGQFCWCTFRDGQLTEEGLAAVDAVYSLLNAVREEKC